MKTVKQIPPKLARRFLLWFLRDDLAEEVLGDLEEKFLVVLNEKSLFKARLHYWYQTINYLRPFATRHLKSNSNYFTMYQHNFKLTYRNFLKYKSTFLINLIGLSTGLACALLIYLWVADEVAVDKFHQKNARLYQVIENQGLSGNTRSTRSTPWLLAEALAEEMPEVAYAAVATPPFWHEKSTLKVKDKSVKAGKQYVGRDYFNIFSYNLIHGDKHRVLNDKNSIVISEDLAVKLFGTVDNILGETIEYQQEAEYVVSGIFENIPASSSIQFDFVLSVELLKDSQPQAFLWKNSGPYTYLVLKEGTDPIAFNEKIAGFIKTKTEDTHRSLLLTKYAENYLRGNFQNGKRVGGRIEYVRLFSIIAIFILIIACINFMNLSTARASRRMKEVGVKKAMGVPRKALVIQYLTESIVLAFLALLLAIAVVSMFLPEFNLIMGKQLVLRPNAELAVAAITITLFTGILAGSYPALYLSGFKPVTILKGKLQNSVGELWARGGLVVFQFTLSVIFIVCVLVVYKQIAFIQTKNIGYNKDNVIHFEIEGKIKENLDTFLTELERIPGVVSASAAAQSMVGGGNTANISWEGKDPDTKIPFAFRPANYGLIELLDLKVTEGRAFSRNYSDSLAVIFNESGIKTMGLKDPIGSVIQLGSFQCKIVGVVKDFHYESLRTPIRPMFFILSPPQFLEKVVARIEAGKVGPTLERMEQFYRKYNPGFVFDFKFLDQDYQNQYRAEQRISVLSRYFAVIAILISCLGLFGLAAFTAERRSKEIGIRKILGAGSLKIIMSLSTDFTKMVLVAITISLPISYFITRSWLSNFAFGIDLEWWFFLGAGLLALLITWLTVGIQTVKAANANPVECLKDE
ncbi:ABC transporter permease [Fulvivirgaceae bacterium BMA12]|uniref:ABC transporter permease n=1 Tax=Agaribacillus aureus TaxID=3051825 RepID=A0ABT8LBV2_9BACT|nr:ABC transporter permease [Fulvivirgaceae bacterium BMA12]